MLVVSTSPAGSVSRFKDGKERTSVIISATDSRRLSREVSTLVRLIKLAPEESIFPSGPAAPVVLFMTSRSKVRSMDPVVGRERPAYSGLAPEA